MLIGATSTDSIADGEVAWTIFASIRAGDPYRQLCRDWPAAGPAAHRLQFFLGRAARETAALAGPAIATTPGSAANHLMCLAAGPTG